MLAGLWHWLATPVPATATERKADRSVGAPVCMAPQGGRPAKSCGRLDRRTDVCRPGRDVFYEPCTVGRGLPSTGATMAASPAGGLCTEAGAAAGAAIASDAG